MRVTKFLFVLAALVLLPYTMHAEEGVILLLKSGKSVGFAFQDKPAIFPGSTLVITSQKGAKVEYAYHDVQRFYWGDVSASSGITPVEKNKVVFHLTDDGITVEGLTKGECVSIYTIDGKAVASATSSNGNTSLRWSSSAKVFIVRTSSGECFKFVRQ